MERREENSTVFVRRGFEDAAPDRNLFPNLLGFREGIVRPVARSGFQRSGGSRVDGIRNMK